MGGGANDFLFGGDGNNTISGGEGNDDLDGELTGMRNDLLSGDAGTEHDHRRRAATR